MVVIDMLMAQWIKGLVDADEKRGIDDALTRIGMRQQDAVGRVMSWWAKQGEEMQQLVLGTLPSRLRPQAIQIIIESLTEESAESVDTTKNGGPSQPTKKRVTTARRNRAGKEKSNDK